MDITDYKSSFPFWETVSQALEYQAEDIAHRRESFPQDYSDGEWDAIQSSIRVAQEHLATWTGHAVDGPDPDHQVKAQKEDQVSS
jgi:hypothetical protein